MEGINAYIGDKIRSYRKLKGLTIQQLADIIHKSRATVCKYENGEITLDVQTLFDISRALDVSLNRLTDYRAAAPEEAAQPVEYEGESPFFKADRLYFYYYDGRHDRLKGVIDLEFGIIYNIMVFR